MTRSDPVVAAEAAGEPADPADRRVRVLVLCAVNGHGGPVQSITTVLRDPSVRSVAHVTVATQLSPKSPEPSPVEQAADDAFHIARPRGFGMLRAMFTLLRHAPSMRRDIDMIHANGLTEAVLAFPMSLLCRTPVTVWVHNSQRPRPYVLVEPLIRRFARDWTWLAVSGLAASRVHADFSVERVVNPVEDTTRTERSTEHRRFRVVYFAGSDKETKGFDLLPDIIRSTDSAVEFFVYAAPPFSNTRPPAQVAWTALTGELSDRVQLPGRTNDKQTVFASADIMLAPSRSESFNRVLAEGVVNGVPFVASDIDAHRQMAQTTGAGKLFDLADPHDAAVMINELAADREVYDRLSASALSHRDIFDVAAVADRIISAWRNPSER